MPGVLLAIRMLRVDGFGLRPDFWDFMYSLLLNLSYNSEGGIIGEMVSRFVSRLDISRSLNGVSRRWVIMGRVRVTESIFCLNVAVIINREEVTQVGFSLWVMGYRVFRRSLVSFRVSIFDLKIYCFLMEFFNVTPTLYC
jgi:hypothetical protein